MNTVPRIASILKAHNLESSITGFPTFDLSTLEVTTYLNVDFPTNVRLGHLVEKIVSELIKNSSGYELLYENVQIIANKKTIGELDFIIKEKSSNQIIHLELAYKFYLFDPTISNETTNNWIGPNRNDSLREKIEKLKTKQFPLLHNDYTRQNLNTLEIDTLVQAVCLLVSLYIPFEYKEQLNIAYLKGIKGYYLNLAAFIKQHNGTKTYYLPPKKEWGIDPSYNDTWHDFNSIEKNISKNMQDQQAPLCWQNSNGSYSQFFIVWW